jgi:hypothetical protein
VWQIISDLMQLHIRAPPDRRRQWRSMDAEGVAIQLP